MKLYVRTHSLLIAFFLIYSFSFSQQQVVVKGTQTIMDNNQWQENAKEIIEVLLKAEGAYEIEWEKKIQNFTATYTTHSLKMVVDQTNFKIVQQLEDDGPLPEEKELGTEKLGVKFFFDQSGNNLKMAILADKDYLDGRPEDFEKLDTIVFTIPVPKKNTITSNEVVNYITQNSGAASDPWKGHSTKVFSLDMDTSVLDVSKGKDSIGINKTNNSTVKLAFDVNGLNILNEFYDKVFSGKYDLAGSDEGGLISAMGQLMQLGMPVYTEEENIFSIQMGETPDPKNLRKVSSYKAVTEVFSVEVVELDASMKAQISSNNRSADNAMRTQQEEKPKGCDCSCEKYKELMALGKKKKKDIDPSKMPQIDMSCIQKCAMEWANCQKN